ncbi:long-chain fatty acid transporter FadL [Yersinia bercovieri]|uniref:long-chain fatty acid transporter FadL n=1 Tax=Yersinia TaxID=629 RepID=UPI0005DACE50|nr:MULTISPECIES: long-chain fatty acid transporter FadL [Yersinia]MCB5302483.1 long-chain fatty acid transporter FadL [Yersinia bercovieri]MDN0104498.1 long-chain fatty acid transporter FadL [Yersinia bercovieri]CNF74401.1 long-chain fatty acid outer membrane transporter [Yersinia bercovieri]CNI31104.1 long-chain fatty acid outer membrane transporter [Yersinia bercovieri]
MNQKNLFTRSALAAAVAIISSNVSAAGFQLNEYSAAALGRSFSGEGAVADNASVGSRNPAAMTLFDRPSFSGGIVYVDPSVDITGTSPVTRRSTSANDIAPSAWIPNIHFIMPLNEQWAIGASGTSNYGLATEFDDNYLAGPIGGKTDLKTANINLAAAYRLNENFSFGLGFNAVYADAKITRTAGELVPIATGGAIPSTTESARLEGKEWGYGWNAGILYEVDKENRYSFTYRSKVKIDFDGDYSNQFPKGAVIGSTVGTGGQIIPGALTLNLPEVWEVSGYNKVAPQWAIHYSLAYTSWSQFQELRAVGNNGQTLFEKHEGFKDAYRIALGTTYYYDDNWTFRTGIAFDDSPVPANNRSISIPDQDRFWISAGTTYAFNKDASVDVGISYMHGQNVKISEQVSPSAPNYQFSSEGTALLYGVNFNYAF